LAIAGSVVVSLVSYVLYVTNYGSIYSSEFILRFRAKTQDGEPVYSSVLSEYTKVANMLHVEPSGDSMSTKLTFDIVMKKEISPIDLSSSLSTLDGVSEVVVVASEHDVDY